MQSREPDQLYPLNFYLINNNNIIGYLGFSSIPNFSDIV